VITDGYRVITDGYHVITDGLSVGRVTAATCGRCGAGRPGPAVVAVVDSDTSERDVGRPRHGCHVIGSDARPSVTTGTTAPPRVVSLHLL
jgi:hypothetical protein